MRMSLLLKTGVVVIACALALVAFSLLLNIFSGNPRGSHLAIALVAAILGLGVAYVIARFVRIRQSAFVIALGGLSLCLTLLIVLNAHTQPISDFRTMYTLAQMLANGQVAQVGSSDYLSLWGYQSFFVMYQALMLKLFGGGISSLFVFNAIFMSGTTVLVYAISGRVLNESSARFVAMVYLLYPEPYLLVSVLTNQHISLFFLLLGIFLLLRRPSVWSALAGGVLIGVGNAFRPDGMLIMASLIALAVVIAINKGKHLAARLQAAAPFALATVCAWLVGPLISALVKLSGVNPTGQANLDPLWKLVLGLNAPTYGQYSPDLATQVFSISDATARHQLEAQIVHQHLSAGWRLFGQLLEKTVHFWGAPQDVNWAFNGQYDRNVPLINKPLSTLLTLTQQIEQWYLLFVVLLAITSLIRLFVHKREASMALVLCGLVVLAFFVVYIVIECQARYRYFIYPFFAILTAYAFQFTMPIGRTRHSRRLSVVDDQEASIQVHDAVELEPAAPNPAQRVVETTT